MSASELVKLTAMTTTYEVVLTYSYVNISKTVSDSAIVCMGKNRKPYAASSNPSLLLTSVDLDTYNSRSSVFGLSAQW